MTEMQTYTRILAIAPLSTLILGATMIFIVSRAPQDRVERAVDSIFLGRSWADPVKRIGQPWPDVEIDWSSEIIRDYGQWMYARGQADCSATFLQWSPLESTSSMTCDASATRALVQWLEMATPLHFGEL